MGLVEEIGSAVGQAIFTLTFGILASLNKLLVEALWQWVIRPMFRPTLACPDISSGSAGGQEPLLDVALQMNRFFLIHWVTPLLLLVLIIIGILFMFGWFQDIRQRIKHAVPGVIFAVILAYTTEIWMDVILDLGRAMLQTVYGAIPQWISPGWVELWFATEGTGGGFGQKLAAQFAPLVIISMMTFIVLMIGVALAVRAAVVYSGIAIMPILCIFLPVPYANKGVKKFIKIWIQAVFFVFFMAIPLVLLKYADGWMQIGFLILTIGMPFLVSTGEVLAMRGAGFPSASRATTAGALGGQLSGLSGPAGSGLKKGGGMLAGAATGGASTAAAGGGMAGKLSSLGGISQTLGHGGGSAVFAGRGMSKLKEAFSQRKKSGEEGYDSPTGSQDSALKGSGLGSLDEHDIDGIDNVRYKSLKAVQERGLAEQGYGSTDTGGVERGGKRSG